MRVQVWSAMKRPCACSFSIQGCSFSILATTTWDSLSSWLSRKKGRHRIYETGLVVNLHLRNREKKKTGLPVPPHLYNQQTKTRSLPNNSQHVPLWNFFSKPFSSPSAAVGSYEPLFFAPAPPYGKWFPICNITCRMPIEPTRVE